MRLVAILLRRSVAPSIRIAAGSRWRLLTLLPFVLEAEVLGFLLVLTLVPFVLEAEVLGFLLVLGLGQPLHPLLLLPPE